MLNVRGIIGGRHQGPRDLFDLLGERGFSALIFIIAGLVAVVGFWIVLPPSESPNLGLLSKKTDHLRAAYDDYNVLLVGTSRTYRGVDPVLLQQVTNDQGCDVRAFNFGISKLRVTELRQLSNQLSPAMLQDYDLILISPLSLSGVAAANWGSNRVLQFTDWEGYRVSLFDVWDAVIPGLKGFVRKVHYSFLLSGAYAYRQLGIGRLANMLRGAQANVGDNPSGDLVDGEAIVDFSRHGYVALDDEPSQQFIDRGQKILGNPERFEASKINGPNIDDIRGATAEKAWRRINSSIEHLADFDIPIALFLPPMPPKRARDLALSEIAERKGVPVLNYNRIDRYPELFERQHWFDYYHVGQSGAEILTSLIGRDICPLVQKN